MQLFAYIILINRPKKTFKKIATLFWQQQENYYFFLGISLWLNFLQIIYNVKHNFGNEIHDKHHNYENDEFHEKPNALKSMSV